MGEDEVTFAGGDEVGDLDVFLLDDSACVVDGILVDALLDTPVDPTLTVVAALGAGVLCLSLCISGLI